MKKPTISVNLLALDFLKYELFIEVREKVIKVLSELAKRVEDVFWRFNRFLKALKKNPHYEIFGRKIREEYSEAVLRWNNTVLEQSCYLADLASGNEDFNSKINHMYNELIIH